MALTTATRGPNVINLGAVKLKMFTCTFTSVTEGEVKTGFGQVYAAWYQARDNDNAGQVYPNSATASSTEDDFGSVFVDSVASGDVGILTVIGV